MANSDVQQKRHPLVFLILLRLIIVSGLLLIVTGFYIHYPFFNGGGGFLMSLMRGVHFFSAGILTLVVAIRVIMMLIGKNRDLSSFIPNFRDLALLPRVIGYYLHICDMPEVSKKYNPLQMIAYTFVFLLAIFQIFTGFALMYPDGAMSWLNYGIFGSEVNTRVAHYIANWIFVLFLIVHTYLAIRDGFKDAREVFMVKGGEEE